MLMIIGLQEQLVQRTTVLGPLSNTVMLSYTMFDKLSVVGSV